MVNYCRKGTLSYCDVSDSFEKQKKCKYYKKSSYFDRCMFLVFGKHCSSIDAQENKFVGDSDDK